MMVCIASFVPQHSSQSLPCLWWKQASWGPFGAQHRSADKTSCTVSVWWGCKQLFTRRYTPLRPPPKATIPLSITLQKCCPSQPVGCLWPKSAFLWLGAERLFLSPDHCERHKKEITSSQRLRRTTSGVARRRLVSSRATFSFVAPLFRRTWNSSAAPCATPPGLPIVSPPALLSRMKEWLFKAKNAEGGDTPERLRASSSAFQPPR